MGANQENRQPTRSDVLETLAEGIEAEAGFTSVVVNMYSAEKDTYDAVVVRGPEELHAELGGAELSRESWMKLLKGTFERFGAFFIPEGQGDWGDDPAYEPATDSGQGENRWRKGDALFALMRCSDGPILGIVSVDSPRNGQRPTDRQILTLTSLCSQAALALDGR